MTEVAEYMTLCSLDSFKVIYKFLLKSCLRDINLVFKLSNRNNICKNILCIWLEHFIYKLKDRLLTNNLKDTNKYRLKLFKFDSKKYKSVQRLNRFNDSKTVFFQ